MAHDLSEVKGIAKKWQDLQNQEITSLLDWKKNEK